MANITQLKCPSCGAILELDSPNQVIVECPYCHQQVVNKNDTNKNQEIVSRIYPSKISLEELKERFVELLTEDESVPFDIFDKMSITNVQGYYLPIYFFEGTYRSTWSSRIGHEEQKQRIAYNGKLENYTDVTFSYASGETTGNFNVNYPAAEGIPDLTDYHNINI